MTKPFEIPLTLDVPFKLEYSFKEGTITFSGEALVLEPNSRPAIDSPSADRGAPTESPQEAAPPRARLSLTPQATQALLLEIGRILQHSREILELADGVSPSDATH